MGLTDALFTGLSGLNANTTEMNVVGNNIANANTTAFKSSRVLLTPQFYVTDSSGTPPSSTDGGTDPSQHGLGASVASITSNFTPGSIQSTGVPTDLAVNGSGFFVVNNAGSQHYTRDGAFTLNSSNQLVSTTGGFVQGFQADAQGNIVPGQLGNLTIPLGASSASSQTTSVTMQGNLNAAGKVSSGASILTSNDITTVGGAAPPTTATLLTTVAAASSSATPAFNVGDTLTLTGSKGERPQAAQTFTVTGTSTVQDLLDFYQTGLGLDTTTANPGVPQAGTALQADASSNNPNVMQIAITGNEGTANALAINGSDFVNQKDVSPLQFADGQNSAGVKSDASGESVYTQVTTFDSLGNKVNIDVTAVLENTSNTGNTWRFFASSADNKSGGPVLGDGTLTFGPAGTLLASTGTTLNIDRSGTGARSPMSLTLNFSGTSELAGAPNSTLVMSNQNGIPPGTLDSFSIGQDGTVSGSYSNGLTRKLGQVALANFANPQGLNNLGGNIYEQGPDSGSPIIAMPTELGTGQVLSGSLELSNVDLSKEFTNLIIASTGFSASSKVISTSDQLIQDLLNSQH